MPVPDRKRTSIKSDIPFLLTAHLLEQNPSLSYMKQQVEVSQIEKQLERNQMLPDFNVGYFSQTIIGTQEVKWSFDGFSDKISGLRTSGRYFYPDLVRSI